MLRNFESDEVVQAAEESPLEKRLTALENVINDLSNTYLEYNRRLSPLNRVPGVTTGSIKPASDSKNSAFVIKLENSVENLKDSNEQFRRLLDDLDI